MYRYAWSIVKDDDSAHDVVQECLTKIWNKRKMLNKVENIDAWMMRIIRNQCYDWVKSGRRIMMTVQPDDSIEHKGADHDLIYNDQRDWLSEVMEQLSDVQREIFHLREIENCSYHEIADTLNLTVNEVKVYLHRARQKVRSGMQKIESYGVAN